MSSRKRNDAPVIVRSLPHRHEIVGHPAGRLSQVVTEQTGKAFQDADTDIRVGVHDEIEVLSGKSDNSCRC